MLMTIPDLLDVQTLSDVRRILDNAEFEDGRLSAGRDAKNVKNNSEVKMGSPELVQLNQLVIGRLYEHPTFQAAAMPLKVSGAFFARYEPGQQYGQHVDDAVMGEQANQYRADVSCTVFLSDQEEYEGGELVIESDSGEQPIKLPAGHAVFYDSGSLHHVNEVTSGVRQVAVGWTQSMIRSSHKRAVLYDMYIVKETLLSLNAESEAAARANRAYINLYRQWAEL